jgi:hypothetical protein
MPTPVIVTRRNIALQYDGTNAADIVVVANTGLSSTVFTVTGEDETGLSLGSTEPSVWGPLFLTLGDWCMEGGGVEPAAVFAGKWFVLGDA